MTEQDFERLCTVVDQTNANDADKEALKHALKYQFTVSSLEARLRGGYDYDDIINTALTATRDFYDADSVLFANTDVNLQVAGSHMRELPREGFPSLSGNDPVYLSRYPLFLKAIEYGQPVAVTDMSQVFPANSVEYKRLCKGKVSSFMAVPYKKRNTGFVGVINPHRYQDTGIYARLSREDNENGESNSITSQKAICMEYISRHSDLELVEIYDEDDGYTGTNMDRPGFQRMLADMRSGKIDCAISKDLSRFSRNYIDAGNYPDSQVEIVWKFKDLIEPLLAESQEECDG